MEKDRKSLKDFFSGLFRKYPERAKRDPSDIECVYAGPEYFERRSRKRGAGSWEPEADILYGAPEHPDTDPAGPEEEDPDLVEVYNGPEFYERNSGDLPEEDPDIVELYAGPEYWDELEEEAEEGPEEEETVPGSPVPGPDMPDVPDMAPVYAGPEYWNPPVGQQAPPEAGAAPSGNGETDDVLAECVYAGPEYWDPSAATGPAGDENEEGGTVFMRPSPPIAFVYGGPDYFANRRDGTPVPPSQFATVYAGPQFWNPSPENREGVQSPFNGVYAAPQMTMAYAAPSGMPWHGINQVPEAKEEKPVPTDPGNRPVCSCCGYVYEFNSKFCPECGTPNPDWDKPEVTDV